MSIPGGFGFVLWNNSLEESSSCLSDRLLNQIVMNRLLFGDNLKWLWGAKIFPDASVDLVYLDPPSNSRVRVERSRK